MSASDCVFIEDLLMRLFKLIELIHIVYRSNSLSNTFVNVTS